MGKPTSGELPPTLPPDLGAQASEYASLSRGRHERPPSPAEFYEARAAEVQQLMLSWGQTHSHGPSQQIHVLEQLVEKAMNRGSISVLDHSDGLAQPKAAEAFARSSIEHAINGAAAYLIPAEHDADFGQIALFETINPQDPVNYAVLDAIEKLFVAEPIASGDISSQKLKTAIDGVELFYTRTKSNSAVEQPDQLTLFTTLIREIYHMSLRAISSDG